MKLLKLLAKDWNISWACGRVGITRHCYQQHLVVDPVFARMLNEVKDTHVDKIESVRFKVSKTKGGAFDRMATLNAFRSNDYNNKIKVEVEQTITHELVLQRAAKLRQAITTQLIQPPKE